MSEEQAAPPLGAQIYETRVYFEPDTGKVISTHQIVGAPRGRLSRGEIETEMKAFEESLKERHPGADFIVVDAKELRASEKGMLVDVENRSIVYPENGG